MASVPIMPIVGSLVKLIHSASLQETGLKQDIEESAKLLEMEWRRLADLLEDSKRTTTGDENQQLQPWVEKATKLAEETQRLTENYLTRAVHKGHRGIFMMSMMSVMSLHGGKEPGKIKKQLEELKEIISNANDHRINSLDKPIKPATSPSSSSSPSPRPEIGDDVSPEIKKLDDLMQNIRNPEGGGGGSGVTVKEDGPIKSRITQLEQLRAILKDVAGWKEEDGGGSSSSRMNELLHKKFGNSTRATEVKRWIGIQIQDIKERLQVTEPPIGLEVQKRKLEDRLISPPREGEEHRNRIICIVGMAGVGKTTLAMLLYDDEQFRKNFDAIAWVTLYEEYNVLSHPLIILEQLSKNKSPQSTGKSQRYLIVLDNVWSTDVWKSCKEKIESPNIPKGSAAILVTTRLIDLAVEVSSAEEHVHTMGLLGKEDSWNLFNRSLKPPLSPELIEPVKEIVNRFRGLPPTIIEMRRHLSREKRNIDDWRAVAEQMLCREGGPWYQTVDKIKKELPRYMQVCLFHFGLIFAKSDVPPRRLIILWAAVRSLIHEREFAMYLEQLEELSMVQVTRRNPNGNIKTYRLLEPLWELWLSEVARFDIQQERNTNTTVPSAARSKFPKDYFQLHLADHLDDKDESYKHIHGNDTKSFRYENLLSFISFDTRGGSRPGKEIKKFISRCISRGGFLRLEVLDLEDVFRPELPKEACKLTRLRYLGLRRTYLVKLPPFIDKFVNLQTLDLKHTYISILPSSIWKMRRLCHLYLSEAYRSRFVGPPCWPLRRVRYLTQLQTLWGAFIDEESPVIGGLNTLTDIRKLGLASRLMSWSQKRLMSTKLDAVADWIAKLKKLKSLRLKSYDENGEPSDLHLVPFPPESELSSIYLLGRLNNPRYRPDQVLKKLFPKNLTEITLSASLLPSDPMKTLGELEKLQILQLFHESYEGEEMSCSKGGFPQLQVLKLWNLDKLKEWHVEKGALTSLTDLEIRACTSLVELPEELPPKLQVLKLCELKKLKKWHVKKGALLSLTDLEIISCTSLTELPEGFPPKLQVLKLCDLEELEKWHVEKGALPSLIDLEIRSCTSLAEFPKGLAPKLAALKLYNMEKLEKWNVEEGALLSLTELDIRSCTSLAELPEEFPRHLRVLKLRNLEKLEQWHVKKGALPSLADLEIRSCTSLAELPEELPPKLQVLNLCELKKLKKWHVKEGALPSLTDLEIRSCTSLAELPEGLQHVTTLKELKLSGMPDEFMSKIKDEESRDQAWYIIKPRQYAEENQIGGETVLLRKPQR